MTAVARPELSTRSVDDLVRDARQGRIRTPQFEGNFGWSASDVLRLFDSIYRGYPIGTLLFWETDVLVGSEARFGGVRVSAEPAPAWVVLDGQQRLVSLVASLLYDSATAQPADLKFCIHFDLRAGSFMQGTAALPVHALPLTEVADTIRYLEWLRTLPSGDERQALVAAANQVVSALRDYRVSVCVVRSNDIAEALEIFRRLNWRGRPLPEDKIFSAIAPTPMDAISERLQAGKEQLRAGAAPQEDE